MKSVKVTLKNGRTIQVMSREIEGLKKAGLLKEDKSQTSTKEEKQPAETKEEKVISGTKKEPEKPKARPVNISGASIRINK